MALFGKSTPRLQPELNDAGLGRICKKIQRPPAMPDARDFLVEFAEQFIEEAGIDWDRRWHRVSVMAETSMESGFDRSWLSRRPNSANALVLNAWTEGLRVRHGESAGELPSAVQRCHQAGAARPHDPLPLVALIGLLRLLRSPQRQVELVWRETVRRDPWNREAHLQMLGYFSEAEFGGPGLAREFVEVQRARMPADAPAAALELTAAVEAFHRATSKDQLNAILGDLWWRRPNAQGVLDRGVELAARPDFLQHAAAAADLNVLAYALVQAGRVPDASPVFRLLGSTVVPWPWNWQGDSVEEFTRWRARARRSAALR
ncbi:hypothetical protein DN069_27500 [Streptacidiphilus pinicola]|uniref:DUF4034 domain-containing protein n=1 Tax=Streptacidiphilus pinicola TaxID=2219663 RepID=A0A2X0IG83_9ACTN|nr:hypothetical protein [Streptacidiphilus pinicola]RAG82421.1 hypothetical protein DN069_27500 [Streptacidiphilus pinicola]